VRCSIDAPGRKVLRARRQTTGFEVYGESVFGLVRAGGAHDIAECIMGGVNYRAAAELVGLAAVAPDGTICGSVKDTPRSILHGKGKSLPFTKSVAETVVLGIGPTTV